MNSGSKKIVITVALFIGIPALLFNPITKALIRGFIIDAVTQASFQESKNLQLAIARQAADTSATFVVGEMGMAGEYSDKFSLMDKSLALVDSKLRGMYCEFGVYQGKTINYIASKTGAPVHGFDSFEGLPENWRPGFEAGTFEVAGLPGVRPNVRLYKGWFKESLPRFAKSHPGPLAFGHLDADLYSSTRDVFEALGDRIVAGTVLQFDEFFNYPGWQQGEFKAFDELCKERQAEVEYIGYVPNDEQVAVRIKRIAPPAPVTSR